MPGLQCKTIICIKEAKSLLLSDINRLDSLLEDNEPLEFVVSIADIYIKNSRKSLAQTVEETERYGLKE